MASIEAFESKHEVKHFPVSFSMVDQGMILCGWDSSEATNRERDYL